MDYEDPPLSPEPEDDTGNCLDGENDFDKFVDDRDENGKDSPFLDCMPDETETELKKRVASTSVKDEVDDDIENELETVTFNPSMLGQEEDKEESVGKLGGGLMFREEGW